MYIIVIIIMYIYEYMIVSTIDLCRWLLGYGQAMSRLCIYGYDYHVRDFRKVPQVRFCLDYRQGLTSVIMNLVVKP